MKPEHIGVGNFDEDNYVYACCNCPLPAGYAIKWPRIKDGKVHSYTCTCEGCGTEVGVISKSYGPEVYKEKLELESEHRVKGTWILVQRGPYIDIKCSECGYTRVKEYAYNYTVDEIDMQEFKDLVVTSKMNYCECCGAKMEEIQE